MSLELDKTQYKSFTQVLIVSCAVSLGTLTYSFQMNSMNDALDTLIIVFDVSPKRQSLVQGLLISSVFIGAFIGALFSSYLLKFRLRWVIISIDTLLIIGSILQVFRNPYIFLLGRLLAGIGSGMHSVIVPVYLKQITPKELFGMMAGLCQMTYAVGYMLTEAYGLILETPDYPTINDINLSILRIYFVAPSIFSIIRILLFLTFVRSESPFFYMQQNNETKAQELIQKIYKKECVESILDNLYQQRDKQDKKIDIFSDTFRIRFRLALFINCLFALCGVNAVLQFSTLIFEKVTSQQIALFLTLLISVMKVLSYSTSAIVSSKVGRRKPFLVGNSVMCVSLIGIGICSLIAEQMSLSKNNLLHLTYFIIVLIFVYLIATFNSISFLATVYLPEIVPGQGVAMAFQSYWFLNIVTLFAFPYAKEHYGTSVCFLFFGFCTLCGQGVLYKYALETANKNETEIDKMFDKFRFTSSRPTQIQESLTSNNDGDLVVDNDVIQQIRDNAHKSIREDE